MSLSVTINNFSPPIGNRQAEVEKIHRMLELLGQNLHAAGGTLTSGNLIDAGPAGNTVLGTWTYTPQASA
jgi:hypothetical protein